MLFGFSILAILLLLTLFPLFKHISLFSLLYILLIPVAGLFSVTGEETRTYYINNKKPFNYLIYSVIITLIELALSYYLVVFVFNNWQGRIIAWIISIFIQAVFSIWLMGIRERLIQFTFSKVLFFKLMVFGYPLIFKGIM